MKLTIVFVFGFLIGCTMSNGSQQFISPGFSSSPTRTEGPGLAIYWATDSVNGAKTIDVATALLKQLEYIQTTPRGSDQIARAIFAQLEVVQLLQGTNEILLEVPK